MAALVVVLLLALLGTWAWQTLSRAGQEPGSEAPEIASAGSTGSEETAAEEGSTGGTEEQVVVSQQGPSERLESSIRANTTEDRVIGSSNVAGVTATMVSPVTSVQPVLPAATRPAVLPATGSAPETPSSAAQVANVPAGNPPQTVPPIPFEEQAPFLGPEAFEEETSFEEVGFEDQSASGGATAATGSAVAIAGSGAMAGSGAVATVG